MEQPSSGNRSLFAPVVLLLLVFSLIGNVLLYSQTLHKGQIDRQEAGTQIIQWGWESKAYFTMILESAESLMQSDDAASRIKAKYSLGLAAQHKDSVYQFINAANGRNGEPAFAVKHRNASEFVTQVEDSLRSAANHDGPFTKSERGYLTLIIETFRELKETSEAFRTDQNSKELALRTQAGGEWINIAGKLLAIMNTPESVLYEDIQEWG